MSVPLGTIGRAFSIVSCLSHLMGSRSSGTALIKSIDPTGSMPPGAIGFPVVGSSSAALDWTKPIRVAPNRVAPSPEPAAWDLTDAGASVPVFSVLGGVGQDFPEGTKIMWLPARPGVETHSVVEAGGMVGSVAETSIFALRSITWYEEPQSASYASDILRAAAAGCPAAILSWTNAPEMVPIRGPKKYDRRDRWNLDIVVNHNQGHHTRGVQGMGLIDLVVSELTDRRSVDGIPFSEPGMKILGVSRVVIDPSVYVYRVSLETAVTIWGTDDTRRAVAAQWARTQYIVPTLQAETGTHPGQLDVVGPATYPQPT